MKVLHIVPSYKPAYSIGGPIESVHNLTVGLVKNGVEVTVYTTDFGVPLEMPRNTVVDQDGVKVIYFPLKFAPWFYSLDLHKSLARHANDFDLIHITSVFLSASTLGSFYARRHGIPYLISPRGNLMKKPLNSKAFKKKLYLILESINLEKADMIHFTTEIEKQEYDEVGLFCRNSVVIPNAFNPTEFDKLQSTYKPGSFRQKFNIPAESKVVLSLSRLNWTKGFDTLIPAFSQIAKEMPDAVLVIAGPDESNYRKKIELEIENCKLKIGKDVIFTGEVLGEDKVGAYLEAQVFVLPSYSENFGQAVVEAMYLKKPVVITKQVGIAYEVNAAQAGEVIEKNPQELTKAVLSLLSNSQRSMLTGEAGRKLVEDKFLIPKVTNRWLEVYQSLIENKKAA